MVPAMLIVCLAAFACLALAMERHQETVFGKALAAAPTRLLRWLGWLGLLAGLWLAVAARGWALGLATYSGVTSLAAGIVIGALIVRERRGAAR
ncbi:DUF3325 family protein [Burkholderia gladioli]|uniref:DUF3325 family protein n=1 Tax=Burkholderia gladioli TaxID=28095 RepID=UPI00163FC88F|nr:DUF3325 family protein [Burkholderia gladioli]